MEYNLGKKTITYEHVKSEFEKRGYVLLEDCYINNSTKMKYKCPKHPDAELSIIWSSFNRNIGCWHCGQEQSVNSRRHSIGTIQEEFKKRGFQLIEKEYLNANQRLKFICPKHPDKDTSVSYSNLKKGRGCKYCGYERRSDIIRNKPKIKKDDPRRLDIEYVKSEFEKRGYTLLEKEYINNSTKMSYRCPIHPDKNMSVSWGNFFRHGSGCPYCAGRVNITFEFVKEQFKKRGYILLEKEYNSATTKMKYICPKHSDKEISISFSAFHYRNQGCVYCYRESITRENSSSWRGGKTRLLSYLHGYTSKWRDEYLEKYDHKCFITGIESDSLNVHHTKHSAIIRNEALKMANLPMYNTIGEYTQAELELIRSKTEEIHKTVEGIPMLKEVHILFHSIYGLEDTNLNDVMEFKKRFLNGEFKDIIINKIKRLEDRKDKG